MLAFGAKIRRRGEFPPVEKVLLTEPVENSVAEIIDPAQLGGTRHLSAHSLHRISAMLSLWLLPRTAALRYSHGRAATRWSMRTESRHC